MENVSRRYFLLQLGEALCDVKCKRQKTAKHRLSAAAGNHNNDAELPGEKRTSCRSCQKKKKTLVRGENCKDYVCGTCSKPVCLKRLPKTEQRLHYVIFRKRNWYIMLISCWSEKKLCSQTTSNVFFFQIKTCLVWKLCLISFPSQLTTMGRLSIQNVCSIVCAMLLILLSSHFEVKSFLFSVSWK